MGDSFLIDVKKNILRIMNKKKRCKPQTYTTRVRRDIFLSARHAESETNMHSAELGSCGFFKWKNDDQLALKPQVPSSELH